MTTRAPAQALWQQRLNEALRLLGTDAAGADALGRADALWLARVLPASALPAATAAPAAHAPARADGTPKQKGKTQRASAAAHDTSGAAPPPQTSAASLFVAQPGAAGDASLAARRVQVPVADALPGRAAIERALKPFLRRRPSPTRRVVDAEATAEASARASAELLGGARPGAPRGAGQTLVPVLRPLAERWFDVVLLAEQDEAMLVFDDTLLELRNLLAHHGAFGNVRLWRWAVHGGNVVVRAPSGMVSGPRAMLQSQRPQLVLVLTHGASGHWDAEPLRKFVRELGRRSVLAIVQLLPEPAWSFTALGEATERVRGRQRGAPNLLLQRLDPWRGVFIERGGSAAVPMLSLDAQGLADWAQWVMAPRLQQHAAVALDAAPPPPALDDALDSAANEPSNDRTVPDSEHAARAVRDQVLRFRAIASEQAFALLRLLAAAWVTLPVMRLLLNALPGPRSASPLAEVLLSGLLLRQSPADAAAQDMVFEFAPGVREWLHDSLSSDEQRQAGAAMAASRESIRRFVEQKTGLKLASFNALLLDPRGTEFLPASAKSFVDVSRRLRSLRGGGAAVGESASGSSAAAAHAPANAPAAAGALHSFPPVVRDLVARPELEEQLARRLLDVGEGQTLRLRALPAVGARTTLARVLRRPALRAHFAGGIWFGVEPPPRAPGDSARLRLALRFGAARGGGRERGDARVELRWEQDGAVDIGQLSDAQAAEHLRGMGLRAEQIERVRKVHLGVPALVPLVGVGTALGIRSWPSATVADHNKRFGTLASRVIHQTDPAQCEGLTEMSVRQPGYQGAPLPGADLAPRLGWLCPGEDGAADTLHPLVAGWFQTWYPERVAAAHGVVVAMLRDAAQGPKPSGWAAYTRRHLLDHARAAGGIDAVRRVLFDRALLQRLLDGDRTALHAQLKVLAKNDKRVGALLSTLQLSAALSRLPDTARVALAPTTTRFDAIGLAAARTQALDGDTIRVAIVSTGVDASHPELQHLQISGATTDPEGNGTAVASVVAGCFIGVAPRVRLHALAPIDASGAGSSWNFVKALSELLAAPPAQRADIVCLPFGSNARDRAMQDVLQRLAEAGMLLVAAAGNDGPGSISFPASLPEVLSVGALAADGTPADYSGGIVPDLWAPGSNMLVARPMASANKRATNPADREYPAPYATQNGTSFACAAVCGLAALVAQATGLRGAALRDELLRNADDGHARFTAIGASAASAAESEVDTLAESASPVQPEQQPGAVEQTIASAVPGQDVVILRVQGGPELVLHPQTAKDLLAAAPRDGDDAPRRSALGNVLLKGFEIASAPLQDDSADFAASAAVCAVDAQVDAGLYALQRDELLALKGSGQKLSRVAPGSNGRPLLVLVHGSFVDTATTFGKLWSVHPSLVNRMFDAFDGQLYALEHPTLGTSSIASALTLVQALPQGADVVLATHGSGGLVAEVLARVAADPSGAAIDGAFMAPSQAVQRTALQDLASLVRSRDLHIQRVVRVACPARGTLLASKRLDAYLSALKWSMELAAIAVPRPLLPLLGEVARRRADPVTLPGLAELAPDSRLLLWLHAATTPVPGSLRVIAGDTAGDDATSWLKTLLADAFFGTDNDLVVQTRSMYGGVPRAGGASFCLAQGGNASHYNYFTDPRSATAFVDAIVLDTPPGFAPIGPLAWAGKSSDGER